MKLNISKSCWTLLKSGVQGVQGVPNSQTNGITNSCKGVTLDTDEGVRYPGCPDDGKNTGQGHRGTPGKSQGVPDTERITSRNNSKNALVDTGDTGDTEKKKGTTTFQNIEVEPPSSVEGCKAAPRGTTLPMSWCRRNQGSWCGSCKNILTNVGG